MAVTSIGATAPGLVASAPWAAAQQPAAAASDQSAVSALHASLAHSTVLGAGGVPLPAQPFALVQQPGAALWCTIPPLATQVGGSAPSAAVPNPAEAARAALFMSQLAAMQAATQAAAPPQSTSPTPAYVAPRTEGALARQPRSTAQATAALNLNELWIPYSTSILGSHSPYPHIRQPEMCFECNAPHSHAGNECPARFVRIFGAPLPGWTRDGKTDEAAWTSDGAAMLQPTREALAKYLKEHGVPAHRHWPVSTTEIAAPQPPERRGRAQ